MVCPLEVTGCEISHTSDSVVIKRALRRSVSEASANEWIALVGDLASPHARAPAMADPVMACQRIIASAVA